MTAEHKRVMQEGIDIVDEVNQESDDIVGKKPFAIVRDPNSEGFKMHSLWIKVLYICWREFYQLCPPKKNLRANLQNHVQGLRHAKLVSNANSSSKFKSLAVSTGCLGRPSRSISSVHNQPDLSGWFQRTTLEGALDELGIPNVPSVFKLIC
jgi:hypothetical protein